MGGHTVGSENEGDPEEIKGMLNVVSVPGRSGTGCGRFDIPQYSD